MPAPGTIQEIYGTIAAGLKQAIAIMPNQTWDKCVSGKRHATKWDAEALRMERQHELAFEGIRWSDMRRYGKAYCIKALETQLGQPIKNNSAATVMKDQNTGYKARYEATWGFRPFPQSEISLSNGVLKQNAGWTDASAQYTNWK